MNKIPIVISSCVLFFLFNCGKPSNTLEQSESDSLTQIPRSQLDIDSALKINSKKHLFLSFWSGMSKEHFLQVLKYEIENGSIINLDTSDFFRAKYGEYIINLEKDEIKTDFQAFFDSTDHLESIGLRVKMEYFDRSSKEAKGYISPYNARQILNLYESKYKTPKVTEDPFPLLRKTYLWESGNKIISISTHQDFQEKLLDEYLYKSLSVIYIDRLKFHEEDKKGIERRQLERKKLEKTKDQI